MFLRIIVIVTALSQWSAAAFCADPQPTPALPQPLKAAPPLPRQFEPLADPLRDPFNDLQGGASLPGPVAPPSVPRIDSPSRLELAEPIPLGFHDQPDPAQLRAQRKEQERVTLFLESVDAETREAEAAYAALTKNADTWLGESMASLQKRLASEEKPNDRKVAAARAVVALNAAYEAGTVTLDLLMEAQGRVADAEFSYARMTLEKIGPSPSTPRGQRALLLFRLKAEMQSSFAAKHTWQRVLAMYLANNRGGEADKEAGACERYLYYRDQIKTTLAELAKYETSVGPCARNVMTPQPSVVRRTAIVNGTRTGR